jgi:hypothetical protein
MKLLLVILLSFFITLNLFAKGTYKTEDTFLKEAFNGDIPKSQSIILKRELRDNIQNILGHPYSGLRIKYWRNDQTTAWVLEEVGKDELITFGFAINDKKIFKTDVLIFRETRGWEIKYPAFTQQFIGSKLIDDHLSQNIDGVSGATLSVYAMKATARLALFLNDYVLSQ